MTHISENILIKRGSEFNADKHPEAYTHNLFKLNHSYLSLITTLTFVWGGENQETEEI